MFYNVEPEYVNWHSELNAHDLVETIRGSVTIDWTQKETVRARMRAKVKRLLRKHGYPPDKREEAVVTVIEQAEMVCRDWAEAA